MKVVLDCNIIYCILYWLLITQWGSLTWKPGIWLDGSDKSFAPAKARTMIPQSVIPAYSPLRRKEGSVLSRDCSLLVRRRVHVACCFNPLPWFTQVPLQATPEAAQNITATRTVQYTCSDRWKTAYRQLTLRYIDKEH